LNVTLAMLGVTAKVMAPRGDGCIVRVRDEELCLDGHGRAVEAGPWDRPVEQATPFALSEFGSTRRLAWPGGGCTVKQRSTIVYWGNRWAAIVDLASIVVIDATTNRQARIELSLHVPWTGCVAHAGYVWIGGERRVAIIALAALEAVVAGSERQVTVEIETVSPVRQEDGAVEARVAWVFGDDDALVNIGPRQVHLYGKHGFEKGTTIRLRDEIYPGTFATAELPDGTRVQLVDPATQRSVSRVKVVRGKSRDPAAHTAPITSTDPRLEALLLELARDPDNDANRLVLVDLLQELGAEYGDWVAQGGNRAKRRAALGPLAHFFDHVEYKGDLPWTATLVSRPPLDAQILADAVGDLRLGMLSTLRIQRGPRSVYTQLVASPRALGLRRIDMVDKEIASALIAANRTQLTHLYDVRLTKAPLVKLLAHPTFDRVIEVEAIVQLQHVAGLLERVRADAHGFFERAPRRLVLRERYRAHGDLLAPAFSQLMELPISELVIGPVEVRRDGDRVTARLGTLSTMPAGYWIDPLADALPFLAGIEVADDHDRPAVARRFPWLTVQ
jgi:hypothetical protein